MSTNGVITFRIDGTDKTVYNHSDSYPSWLGVRVLEGLKSEVVTPDAVRALRVVTEDTPPTAEDRAQLAPWTCNGCGAPDEHWYRLLRETQGDIVATMKAGVILDASQDFYHFRYVIDLDALTFAVYDDEPPAEPLASWRLDHLPTEAEFIEAAA